MTEEQAREAALEQAMQRAFISDAESRTNREYITEIFDAGVEYANRWTYCEDALPTKDGQYICTMQRADGFRYSYPKYFEVGSDIWTDYTNPVIAWREMPEPAKR